MKKKLLSLFVALVATTALWASNVITYTASEKLPEVASTSVPGFHPSGFKVKMVSHTFSNGVGTITFDGEITTIGDDAFRGCSGLTSVTIPDSVTTIGGAAFFGCSGLTSVIIPSSVITIGIRAFNNCISLTSITIPNSVTKIDLYAFNYCRGLTSITIPNSVTYIGTNAFSSVNNVIYEGTASGAPWGAQCLNGYVDEYLVYSDANKTKLCGCSTAATGDIVLPNSVVTIIDGAFRECSGLTSVTINGVDFIGQTAFWNCTGLKSAVINGANSIRQEAFRGCTGLKSVTLNNVYSIGEYAFRDCSGLESVTLDNVSKIEDGAFYNCSSLTKTNTTGTIKDWCMMDFSAYTSNPMCYSHNLYINDVEIKDLIIPTFITTIKQYTFYGCSGLTSVSIPKTVTTIEGGSLR